MSIQEQIYTIWLPLGITLLFGLIGVLRGAVRETVVAAAVALAALINLQWAGQWSEGLAGTFKDLNQGQVQFTISFVVLWLVVMAIGYGLGYFAPKEPVSTLARLSGGLLGLANGAAVAGWSLRYAYTNLDGAQTSSQFYQNALSYSLMVWAAWFPLMLALLGAVLVLVGPLRRAQTAIARPAKTTDWEPYTPQPAPPVYDPGATAVHTPTAPLAWVRPAEALAGQDAPAASLPTREVSAEPMSARVSPTEQGASMETRQISAGAPAEGAATDDTGTYNSPNTTSGVDSSWLLHPAYEEDGQSESAAAGEAGAAPPAEPAKTCSNCGTPVAPGASFCTECGTRVT